MANLNIFAFAFFIALSFSSIDSGMAARNLLQVPTLPSIPTLSQPLPSLPKPTLPPMPSIPTLPVTQTSLPIPTLPPMPSIPTIPSIPEVTLPPLPSTPLIPSISFLSPLPGN